MSDNIAGRVEGLYIKRSTNPSRSVKLDEISVTWAGFEGDKHAGETMPAAGSQKPYPKGAEVRNTRQLTIVSVEEMEEIAKDMDIPAIDAEWVNANILISGIEDFTQLPSGTRIFFENGVGIVVESANPPCTSAGGQIQEHYPEKEGLTQAFPQVALGRRGVFSWVERPGRLSSGESFQIRRP